MTLYKHELKDNLKVFFIWTISICMICLGCILMYGSVEESLNDMGDELANMGAMSTALGLDRLSINTMTGYFATEISLMHTLGGAMFAAILGSNLLSKEEYLHTAEFLLTLPISRISVVTQKVFAMISYLVLFQISVFLCNILGFVIMKEEIQWSYMMKLTGTQLLLFIEVSAISLLFSAISRKSMIGAGLGITLIFFITDMMCRVVPVIENLKYFTPFYYANATDIFTGTKMNAIYYTIAVFVVVIALIGSYVKYNNKEFSV